MKPPSFLHQRQSSATTLVAESERDTVEHPQDDRERREEMVWDKTPGGEVFRVPTTHNALTTLFHPGYQKSHLDLLNLALLALQVVLFFFLSREAAQMFFLSYFAFWRAAYDGGLAWVLTKQSKKKWIVREVQRLGWLDEKRKPAVRNWVRKQLADKMGRDYSFDDLPLEYNTWLLFRQAVDVILVNDFLSYCMFAFSCFRVPESLSTAVHAMRWLSGIALISFNIWVKTEAHNVVKDYGWYWGDVFFQRSAVVFDGVFELAPHPMYSIGYAGYYGLSLISGSYAVLFASLAAHAAQFAFLVFFETPHVERTYGKRKAIAKHTPLLPPSSDRGGDDPAESSTIPSTVCNLPLQSDDYIPTPDIPGDSTTTDSDPVTETEELAPSRKEKRPSLHRNGRQSTVDAGPRSDEPIGSSSNLRSSSSSTMQYATTLPPLNGSLSAKPSLTFDDRHDPNDSPPYYEYRDQPSPYVEINDDDDERDRDGERDIYSESRRAATYPYPGPRHLPHPNPSPRPAPQDCVHVSDAHDDREGAPRPSYDKYGYRTLAPDDSECQRPQDDTHPGLSRQTSHIRPRDDPDRNFSENDGYSRQYAGADIPIPHHTPSLEEPPAQPAWRDWVAEGNHYQQARSPPNVESFSHRRFKQPPPSHHNSSPHDDRPSFDGRETNSLQCGDSTATNEYESDEDEDADADDDDTDDDDDDDSSEDGIEAKRLRDLEAKMQKLKENRREADDELVRMQLKIQQLVGEEARKKKEAEEGRDEVRRKEEDAKRRQAEARKKEAEILRLADEVKQKEEEATKMKAEAKKREEEAKIMEREARIKEEDAKKKEEAAKLKEDEAKRKAEELNRKEEEVMQRAAQLEQDTEKTKKMQWETQKFAEDLKKMEEQALKKDMEMKEREDILRRREAEVMRREADKEDEAKRKAEELNRKEEEVMQRAAQLEQDTEKTKELQLEAEKFAEDLKKMESETLKKDIEIKEREDILRRREAELMRREEDNFRREEEAKKKEAEPKQKKAAARQGEATKEKIRQAEEEARKMEKARKMEEGKEKAVEGNRHPNYDYHRQARSPPNVESFSHRRFKQPPPSYHSSSTLDDRPSFGGRETNSSHRAVTDEYESDEDEDADADDDDTDDDDDDDSSEDGIEAKRLRDLEAKMQKLKENRREADDELVRMQLKIQQLVGEEARKKKEAEEGRDEVRRKEEDAKRRQAEARKKEAEILRLADEVKQKEEEATKMKAEAKKREEEAKIMEREARIKEEDAKKKEAAAKQKEDEAKRKAEELSKEEEARERAAQLEQDAEKTKKIQLQAQKMAEDLKRMEVEAFKKGIEIEERKDILRRREAELMRREADNCRREEEAKKKEETKQKEAAARQEEARKEKIRQEQEEARRRWEEWEEEIRRDEERKKQEAINEREAKKRAAEAKKEEDNWKLQEEAKRRDEAAKRNGEDSKQGARLADICREQEEKRLQNESQVDDAFNPKTVNQKLMEEQLKVLREAEFRKREEEIRRIREERKRNDHWPGSSYLSASPGTSSGMSGTPSQFSNGPSIPERSPGPSTGGRGAGPAPTWGPSIRPTAATPANSSSASTATGKPRTGFVSSGTYPMSSSPHTASFSEAERTRKRQEFAGSQQEQFRRAQEKLEAKRQSKSAGRQFSREELQRIFEHHERLWTRLNTLNELSWNDFPWPMAKQPSNPDDMSLSLIDAYIQSPFYPDKDKSRTPKDRIKEHIKRWHPDRFETKLLPKVVEDEREKVKHGAGNVARYLSDLLRKENESSLNLFGD